MIDQDQACIPLDDVNGISLLDLVTHRSPLEVTVAFIYKS